MYTITIDSPNGERCVYKYSDKTFVDAWKLSGYKTLCKLSKSYSTDDATKFLIDNLTLSNEVMTVLIPYRSLSEKAIEIMYDLADIRLDELNATLRSVDVSHDRAIVRVPDVLRRFLDVYSNDRGLAVGKGEILACLLLKNASGVPNARYDITIDGIPWHIKDHRNCDSTPLGRPTDENGLTSWKNSDIFNFVWRACNLSMNFGNTSFKNRSDIEDLLLKRYGTDDLAAAAGMFEHEISEVVRNSTLFGDAPGIIFLKHDDIGEYFEFVPKKDIYFHSTSADGIKICDVPGRYVDTIMFARNEIERLNGLEELKRQRILERAKLAEERRTKKLIERDEAVNIKKLKRYNDARYFNELWNLSIDVKTLASNISIGVQAAIEKKKRLEKEYPEFLWKQIKRREKVSILK